MENYKISFESDKIEVDVNSIINKIYNYNYISEFEEDIIRVKFKDSGNIVDYIIDDVEVMKMREGAPWVNSTLKRFREYCDKETKYGISIRIYQNGREHDLDGTI